MCKTCRDLVVEKLKAKFPGDHINYSENIEILSGNTFTTATRHIKKGSRTVKKNVYLMDDYCSRCGCKLQSPYPEAQV